MAFVTLLGVSVFRVENYDVEQELNNEHAVDNPDEIAASVEMWVFFFYCFHTRIYDFFYKSGLSLHAQILFKEVIIRL